MRRHAWGARPKSAIIAEALKRASMNGVDENKWEARGRSRSTRVELESPQPPSRRVYVRSKSAIEKIEAQAVRERAGDVRPEVDIKSFLQTGVVEDGDPIAAEPFIAPEASGGAQYAQIIRIDETFPAEPSKGVEG